MRGTKAKAMRRYVEERFPFLSASPLYRKGGASHTQAVLATECMRHVYQKTKRAYKRARQENTTAWRSYNERRNNTSTR